MFGCKTFSFPAPAEDPRVFEYRAEYRSLDRSLMLTPVPSKAVRNTRALVEKLTRDQTFFSNSIAHLTNISEDLFPEELLMEKFRALELVNTKIADAQQELQRALQCDPSPELPIFDLFPDKEVDLPPIGLRGVKWNPNPDVGGWAVSGTLQYLDPTTRQWVTFIHLEGAAGAPSHCEWPIGTQTVWTMEAVGAATTGSKLRIGRLGPTNRVYELRPGYVVRSPWPILHHSAPLLLWLPTTWDAEAPEAKAVVVPPALATAADWAAAGLA